MRPATAGTASSAPPSPPPAAPGHHSMHHARREAGGATGDGGLLVDVAVRLEAGWTVGTRASHNGRATTRPLLLPHYKVPLLPPPWPLAYGNPAARLHCLPRVLAPVLHRLRARVDAIAQRGEDALDGALLRRHCAVGPAVHARAESINGGRRECAIVHLHGRLDGLRGSLLLDLACGRGSIGRRGSRRSSRRGSRGSGRRSGRRSGKIFDDTLWRSGRQLDLELAREATNAFAFHHVPKLGETHRHHSTGAAQCAILQQEHLHVPKLPCSCRLRQCLLACAALWRSAAVAALDAQPIGFARPRAYALAPRSPDPHGDGQGRPA
eukprot:scaffold132362_cov69-Phaeocystis_antarctica.AAC.1